MPRFDFHGMNGKKNCSASHLYSANRLYCQIAICLLEGINSSLLIFFSFYQLTTISAIITTEKEGISYSRNYQPARQATFQLARIE